MGEPQSERDPEKGQPSADSPHQSLGEGITNLFSKAGEGITSVITKAGEGIHATGTTLKDGAKSAGAKVVGLGASQNPQKQKKNPQRAKHEKKFHKSFKPIPREEPKDTNIVGNITKLLPANTFLMFQTLAPLATNDGHCGRAEIIMTSAMLIILASTCMLVCFTDTIQFNGKVYHGLVTPRGLWNPSFKGDPSFADLRQHEFQLAQFYEARRRYKAEKREARKEGQPVPPRPEEPLKPMGPHVMGSTYSSGNSQYQLNFTDFMHAILSAMAFGTLTMLTNPVSTCFYPNIPSTVVKTLPLLVGFVISAIFAFSPPARNGIAHPLSPKVPSQMDNYKPPDPKGIVHGPSLPPKPPGKGDHHANSKMDDDDDDDLGDSVKKYLGKFFGSPNHEKGKSGSPTEHHQLDGMKAIASGLFSKYGDGIKHGAEAIAHSLQDGVKKEASQLSLSAAPAIAELSKDIHIPLALQEAAKSVPHDALVAGLVNAGAHPVLAIAAVQSAVQEAKDATLNQIQQELHAATSASLASLSKQTSMVLARADSMLQSAGPSLSLPSGHDALFHQAAQVLQRQVSGLSPNVHPGGSEAAAIALAAGQALVQSGYQFPSTGLSPQATALSAFARNVGNQLNLNSANELVKDASSLVHQGSKSIAEIQEEFARQSVALNSQLQALSVPSSSVAQSIAAMANSGSQALSQGTLAATLAAGVAREAGTLLLEGADHGMAGVQAEIERQKAAAIQSVVAPATSLAQEAASRGSQSLSDAKAELLKQKEGLTQEMHSQARALSTPATSVAQDLSTLFTTQSQPTVSAINSQFVETLARGVAQGMAQAASQPAASVAIDVDSLLQQGSRMHAQLSRQASSLSPQLQAAASLMQRQLSIGNPQQLPAVDTQMAIRRLASQLSPLPLSPEPAASQWTPASTSNWRDNASLVIEDVTDAAAAGQRAVDHAQRGAAQLPRVTEEIVAHAATQAPTASQIQSVTSEIVIGTPEAARQASLPTRILRSDRPESTEIIDSISMEEITSESETEHNNHGNFRAGSFNLHAPSKRKL